MKAIVFDMDGVLFDTERVSDRAWSVAAEEMHFTEDVAEAKRNCRGLNRKDATAYFAKAFPTFDYEAFRKRNRAIMLQMLEEEGMPVKEGAYALLDWLKETGWKIALATSTGEESTTHHLKAANMTEYFDVVVTGEQVEQGKPAPEIYETACERLEATPTLSFAVEDSPNGIQSAFSAGMRVIMVPDLIAPTLELRQKVVTVQSSLLGVKAFLEKYGE